MRRAWRAMERAVALLLAAGLLASAPPAEAARKPGKADLELQTQLMAHITELASDAYEGREPGTEGESRTLRYLGKQWFELGLESGTNDPGHSWFAPVTLVAREPDASRIAFTRKGRRVYVSPGAVRAFTSAKRALVENAPMLFVGTGRAVPTRAELAGRVALLLDGGIENSERQSALLRAGASAVLTVLDGDRTLDNVIARRGRSGYALDSDELGGDLEGFISKEGLDGVLAGSGQSLASLRGAATAPDFAPRLVDLSTTLEATTRETRINTHNLIGKLSGRRPGSGAVLLMAHWDHFGKCAEAPAPHLICNGAVDNASGVAVLTEVARRLSRLPELDRDVYFLATTAEELGLLGAHAFAENPPLPLKQIVAAFNIDTVAIAPAGSPLAIVGKGMTPLDAGIAAVAKAQKKKLVEGDAANAFVRRQDGFALLQHDVPAVLVSTAWSDMARMERFMESDYHRPSDVVKPGIELGGAADDVNFLVALTRWFADLKKVPPPAK